MNQYYINIKQELIIKIYKVDVNKDNISGTRKY